VPPQALIVQGIFFDLGGTLFSSALAGAYVGIAVVVLVSISAPLAAAGNPATKLVQAAVFGIALVLVVFAGSELFTGNAMFMIQGLRAGSVTMSDLMGVWVASLFGNLVGSMAVAGIVNAGGTLAAGAANGRPGAGQALINTIVESKNSLTGGQLFWRSVLCNMLVCLALWMAGRASGDGAKLVVLWWPLLAFIGSGFEHSIANMTIYSLGVFGGTAEWGDLARNLLYTVPGNVVGGGILVGLGYAWLGGAKPAPAPADVDLATEPVLVTVPATNGAGARA